MNTRSVFYISVTNSLFFLTQSSLFLSESYFHPYPFYLAVLVQTFSKVHQLIIKVTTLSAKILHGNRYNSNSDPY